MGKLYDLIERLRKPRKLDDETERHMERLHMTEREKDALRRIWGKKVEQKEFPECLGCGTMFDPDYMPPELPPPSEGYCSVCVASG